jgi:hypothetical protein
LARADVIEIARAGRQPPDCNLNLS